MTTWKKLPCSVKELRLDFVLACGQSFRWIERKPKEWTSVLAGKVWTLSQNDTHLLYKVYEPPIIDEPECNSGKLADGLCSNEDILKDYFQLKINLQKLYNHWGNVDAKFKETAHDFPGIRMLRQDPVENLFSFICSSNNHISRISGMVERMCESFGTKLMDVEGITYYSFPTVNALSQKGVEEKLRQLGFGYRAKYISQTAQYINTQKSSDWLHELRDKPYAEAKLELLKLNGVGAKVADCVLLMSLDKAGAIPVDTHVWQIAARDYLPKLNTYKSVTEKVYNEIGDCFRELWGDYAGWAHSVLFSADLRKFKEIKSSPQKAAKKRKSSTKTAPTKRK